MASNCLRVRTWAPTPKMKKRQAVHLKRIGFGRRPAIGRIQGPWNLSNFGGRLSRNIRSDGSGFPGTRHQQRARRTPNGLCASASGWRPFMIGDSGGQDHHFVRSPSRRQEMCWRFAFRWWFCRRSHRSPWHHHVDFRTCSSNHWSPHPRSNWI